MSLRDLDIKTFYSSDEYPNLGRQFISNMLEESCIYKRAAGFFSSSCLINLTKGLGKLFARPNSHVYFVVSPFLSKEDVDAINKGYENRDKIIENALLREFKEPKDEFEEERLNYLCHKIEEGKLDIKIADKLNQKHESGTGMFHEKMGYFEDECGNKVAFIGSLNESENAYSNNFESITVFKSWEATSGYVNSLVDKFEKLWSDVTNTLRVYDFPTAVKKALFKYRKDAYNKNIDEKEGDGGEKEPPKEDIRPHQCEKIKLYKYQKEAIQNWANQGFKGLFDMGTGTGKTITALTADVILLKKLNYKMATIIVCPYIHLVEQWIEEKDNFGIEFIVGYSNTKYKDYISRLREAIQNFNDGIVDYFYFITTNASYRTEKVQAELKKLKGNVLFIADEVHNFGAQGMQNSLIDSFKYRIGLSATIDIHNNEIGTKAIYDYFSQPVIHYGLKEAINDNVLTRYYYHPILVTLTDLEKDKYREITKEIGHNLVSNGQGSKKLTKKGEQLLMERARLVATAANKISILHKLMNSRVNDKNMLVYCGTGKVSGGASADETKQLDAVCNMLGNELHMKIARYTSRENIKEREEITERYKEGDLQAVVAIKCLDEGVNIPCIETAYIMASSTNPREYIQRRGRVLRKFPGKEYSYIYDFVTMPFELDENDEHDDKYLTSFKSLAKNEIERMKEFSSLAENEYESDKLIESISKNFGLNDFEIQDEFKDLDWEEFIYEE